jgi:hypothetical protein
MGPLVSSWPGAGVQGKQPKRKDQVETIAYYHLVLEALQSHFCPILLLEVSHLGGPKFREWELGSIFPLDEWQRT